MSFDAAFDEIVNVRDSFDWKLVLNNVDVTGWMSKKDALTLVAVYQLGMIDKCEKGFIEVHFKGRTGEGKYTLPLG